MAPREAADVGRILDEHTGEEESEHADGQIDVEDPAPGVAVGDPAAEGWADDRRNHDADAVNRHRGAVLAGREALEEDGLGDRLHSAAANALQDAGEDEHGHVDGEAAEQGSDGEEHDREREQALASDAAGDPAGSGKHDGVRDEIAGENPGCFVGRGGKIAGDVRQGNVGDRGVEDDHEGRGHHRDGDHPAIGGRRPVRGLRSGGSERSCGRGGQRVLARSGLRESGFNKPL